MRLLRVEKGGGYSLTEFSNDEIPPYAILSHTWEADDDEVSFRDLQEGTGKEKKGHRKLAFCAKQAANDGLEFFWVDTCCIDKSSSSELSEAINSMFRWYHNSARCYVYLAGMNVCNFSHKQKLGHRWFTRGWTLQELLAPKDVEFFLEDGVLLGSRSSPDFQVQIAEICGIPPRALQGAPLSSFSVEERMSWARRRTTKKEEDMAYSLLGIFGCHMPLIYGEGKAHAFQRLHNKIEKADKNKSAVPDLDAAAEIVLAALSEKLDGSEDTAEIAWDQITKRWKHNDRCCNCGSADHWEYECEEVCGRCESSTVCLRLTHADTCRSIFRTHSLSVQISGTMREM
jgi:hypothetical protein